MTQALTLDAVRAEFDAPENVPEDRKVDLNFAMGSVPNDLVDPYEPCEFLNHPDIPRLLYNKPSMMGLGAISGARQGNWVVTHYEDIDRVYTDNEHFSNAGTAEFQRLIGETFKSIPLAIDPPDHAKYRMFLWPYFSPARITRDLEPEIRKVCVEMIEEIADKGEVDMAWDFARVFPVRIFMGLMGFPKEMFDDFLEWEWNILHSGSLEKMQWALSNVLKFLRGFIAEKEANPDPFLTSSIVHGEIEGRPLTEDEKIGIVWFLWLGGLDTVAATIAQMYRRMALQPELQQRIRENPEIINSAVEEFLRTQPILSSARTATKDFEWHGIQVKKGDSFSCLNPSGNFDPARFEDPRTFNPERKGNRHFTFVGGIHTCLGAHLARRELRVLLEEWFKRIPEFRVKPGADTTVFPGLLSIRNLPLVWDPAKA
ncbi:cytochrome [Novosphingobium sp. PC22D]|uniref:cytochrome P450 n=1 Tax=Novosphingobium sp. PC22D TaxID=1962403 RepID=UPI000BF17DE8|nr:cytochrome P450 [Novosphingobium sp. PC22D]PEQ12023.1 cytochrome [Novosphingobium sp. PC22D]